MFRPLHPLPFFSAPAAFFALSPVHATTQNETTHQWNEHTTCPATNVNPLHGPSLPDAPATIPLN